LESGAPKALIELEGVPLVRRASEAACGAELVDALIVAAPAGYEDRFAGILDGLGKTFTVVAGGETRQASAAQALAHVGRSDAVAVHDAARALCPPSLFDACLRELDECDAVCPAVPLSDTVKEVAADVVVRTLDRSRLAAVQTPQAFRSGVYRRAHEAAARDGFVATDDASLVERLGVDVRIIPGAVHNMKITTRHDLLVASALLRAEA
jgi:2-C-methyl-D-erythritol 4-phosphate cytidylyltransferase